MNSNQSNSRRSFLKTAGGVSLGMAGMTGIAASMPSEGKEPKQGQLFVKEIAGVKDRVERVKIATLGMQRY
ncbi:MAG TPA: hypothetical protein VFG54_05950, partial [Prolixibacteraceae bacterium]|nr:hypothetical protein [Prolixibacteraceae bacterium]